MPVYRYAPRQRFRRTFVSRLADEWSSRNSKAKEPVILEQPNQRGEIEHIYVIWSEWAHLDRTARGEIIMEAAEKVKDKDDVMKLTIAMGLTPDEADRFGLDWRPKRTT